MSDLYFVYQPHTERLGTLLTGELQRCLWTELHIAVAWARPSGVKLLRESLRTFLGGGNIVRVVVGIDDHGTSQEGLEELLRLEEHGDLQSFVHHNESNHLFHPKVYLLVGSVKARLYIGSSNLTRRGLFTNTEAGVRLDTTRDSSLVMDVRTTIERWSDPGTGLARKLDRASLAELVQEGYVLPETKLREEESKRRVHSKHGEGRKALFAKVPVTAPAVPKDESNVAKPSTAKEGMSGTVLIMRVRVARGSQIQVPIRLFKNEPFFQGVSTLKSSHDGAKHGVHQASARPGQHLKGRDSRDSRHAGPRVATGAEQEGDPLRGARGGFPEGSSPHARPSGGSRDDPPDNPAHAARRP